MMDITLPCKQGTVYLASDGTLHLQRGWKTLWQVPSNEITKLTVQESAFPQEGFLRTFDLLVYTTQGRKGVTLLTKSDVALLQARFPALIILPAWYKDIQAETYVKIYSDQRYMNEEIEEAARYGWAVQNIAATLAPSTWGKTLFLIRGGGTKHKKIYVRIHFVQRTQREGKHPP